MMDTTLCYLMKGNEILLGLKKRGFAKGKWNAFGGKRAEGESVKQAVAREMFEECNVRVNDIEKVAELDFFFPDAKKEWNQRVHVFLAREWEGEPIETEEMKPKWFRHDNLPYEKMWSDDIHWLPLVLSGQKIRGRFHFADDNESIARKEVGLMDDEQEKAFSTYKPNK